MFETKYFCPVNGWDCPYWRKDGTCELEETAIYECDDAAAIEEWLEDVPPLSEGEVEFEPGRIYWNQMAANP